MNHPLRPLLSLFGSLLLIFSANSIAANQQPTKMGQVFKGPIGLQLYSLREQFAKDVSGTLDEVKNIGFKNAELAGTYGLSSEKFKEELKVRGIKPIAAHFGYERYRDEAESVAKEAKELGLEYAGCAWIPHSGDFDEKTCREAIAVFNKAGEVMA